jgi:hypothetical protein
MHQDVFVNTISCGSWLASMRHHAKLLVLGQGLIAKQEVRVESAQKRLTIAHHKCSSDFNGTRNYNYAIDFPFKKPCQVKTLLSLLIRHFT